MRVVAILFVLLLSAQAGVYSKKMDKEIEHYYKVWKKSYLIKVDKTMYRVATDKTDKSKTVSEGQGYGMLFAVLLADSDKEAKKIFDGLWRFSRVHKSPLSRDLMAWQVPEVAGENDSAFDGDADIAYALIEADKRWGSSGFINYKKEAKKVLQSIWHYTIGQNSFLPLLGDWVEQNGKKYNQYTVRTSDFMFDHFRTFYNFSKDIRWLKVLKATQQALLDVQNPKTGLVPDFIRYDFKTNHFVPAKDGFLEHHDGEYYYNACRVPFRVGIDALKNRDKISLKIAKKLSTWSKVVSYNNPLNLKSGFGLDGKAIGEYFSTIFIAPMGVSAMSDKDEDWGKKIFDVVKNRHENYYEDSVTLLSLMGINGRF